MLKQKENVQQKKFTIWQVTLDRSELTPIIPVFWEHGSIVDHNNIYWETKLSIVKGMNFLGIDYKFFALFSILIETTNAVITDLFSFFLTE